MGNKTNATRAGKQPWPDMMLPFTFMTFGWNFDFFAMQFPASNVHKRLTIMNYFLLSFLLSTRCEDHSEGSQRQTAVGRADGHHGTFRCGKKHAAKHSHRLQVRPAGGEGGKRENKLCHVVMLYSCRTTNIEGSITMNGKERNLSQFRKLSAYIMQDNQLHANLTVEEAMHVATSLKLSQRIEKSEKLHVVSYY